MTPNRDNPEDNPFYLLATLSGEPNGESGFDMDRHFLNAALWNNYFFGQLKIDQIEILKTLGPFFQTMTIPKGGPDIGRYENLFRERAKGRSLLLPKQDEIPDLSGLRFSKDFRLTGFVFPNDLVLDGVESDFCIDFSLAAFFGEVRMIKAHVGGNIKFDDSYLAKGLNAGNTKSERGVCMRGATCRGLVRLDEAEIGGRSWLTDSEFSEGLFLRNSKLGSFICDKSKFSGFVIARSQVDFFEARGAEFSESDKYILPSNFTVDFSGCKFQKRANFNRAVFSSSADFRGVSFLGFPPSFFEAKIGSGVVWPSIGAWPLPIGKFKQYAVEFEVAYGALRAASEGNKNYVNEGMFFEMEMKSRAARSALPYSSFLFLYSIISRFGQSMIRPILSFITLAIVGVFVFYSNDFCCPHPRLGQSLGFSFSNMFGPLGLQKYVLEEAALRSLSPISRAFAAVQSIAGSILIFLFGLAVRNQFRMR